jgi:hypothetical protein
MDYCLYMFLRLWEEAKIEIIFLQTGFYGLLGMGSISCNLELVLDLLCGLLSCFGVK